MTQLLARIMLALLMLPLASLVYLLTLAVVDELRLFRSGSEKELLFTGLVSTQCPECGSRFTLDELLAVRRVDEEIET